MPTSASDIRPALVLDAIDAGYGDRAVLHKLSLTVAAGSIYALLGPNGAGKSTVARVACGLTPVRAGRVSLGQGARLRARIGLAPQESALFPALSARENVEVVARLAGVSKAERAEAIRRALNLTGCEARADEVVQTLSGGWRRRVNLAAALVGQPTLVVADEPTEGVDVATRASLAAALRASALDGTGCLLISHDAAFVTETADRIGVLDKGTLVLEGAPGDLLREAFGAARLLSVRLPRPAGPALAARLSEAGLASDEEGLEWRRLTQDALALAQDLSPLVDAEAGEVAVRRPGLDELIARLSGRLA